MDRREVTVKWYESFDAKEMIATVNIGDEQLEVKCHYEVCDTCDGKGKHVNPSIDGNGLSREDFDQDPNFFEDYMSGAYDVQCNECRGDRVVPQPNDDDANFKRVTEYMQEQYAYAQQRAREREMGY